MGATGFMEPLSFCYDKMPEPDLPLARMALAKEFESFTFDEQAKCEHAGKHGFASSMLRRLLSKCLDLYRSGSRHKTLCGPESCAAWFGERVQSRMLLVFWPPE